MKSETQSATSNNFGFSPRIEPRPKYPSAFEMFLGACKEILYQGGFIGTLLCVLLYPYYISFCNLLAEKLSVLLGEYYNENVLFSVVLSLTHTVTYVIVTGSFAIFDNMELFQKYKLHRRPHMLPKQPIVIKTLIEATINQAIVGPVVSYFLFPVGQYFGMSGMLSALPSYQEMFLGICFAAVFNGFMFYWAHRTFHSKPLYATFHKQHHEYSGPISISAEYANPLEQVLANQIPSIGGALIFGRHPLVLFVWVFLRAQETYEAHSGYCFKNTIFDYLGLAHADDATHHDFHHSVNQGNFGIIYMDWLFGTMDGYCAAGYQEGYIAKKFPEIKKN